MNPPQKINNHSPSVANPPPFFRNYPSSGSLHPTPKQRVAVVTTGEGGGVPGVNAAIRAVVRSLIVMDVEPWVVLDGFSGLIAGGDKLMKVERSFVAGIIEKVWAWREKNIFITTQRYNNKIL